MIVRIVNKSKHQIPEYATESSAGMDLRANLQESIDNNIFILKKNNPFLSCL